MIISDPHASEVGCPGYCGYRIVILMLPWLGVQDIRGSELSPIHMFRRLDARDIVGSGLFLIPVRRIFHWEKFQDLKMCIEGHYSLMFDLTENTDKKVSIKVAY